MVWYLVRIPIHLVVTLNKPRVHLALCGNVHAQLSGRPSHWTLIASTCSTPALYFADAFSKTTSQNLYSSISREGSSAIVAVFFVKDSQWQQQSRG